MGGFFQRGEWITKEQWESGEDGSFERQVSSFRGWVEDAPGARFAPEAGRYHLVVSLACPWAHRVLIARALRGLEDVVSVSVTHPFMGDDGWSFEPGDGVIPDPIMGAKDLRELYRRADPEISGRVTVPILWDREHDTIVNNESREIMRMFDTAFGALATTDIDLYPEDRREQIDEVIEAIYEPINNGVYRCGFARTQEAYARAFTELFEALERWDAHLSEHRYLCGDRFTEADVCMFTTLVRFDPVYYIHFKCSGRHVYEYPNLSGYMREIYQMPGVAQTVNMEHIRQHYYTSHPNLNPRRFVPLGPEVDLDAPHRRDHL